MNQQRAIIIGAGIGGLSIANLLAYTGWEVHVYDKLPRAGGRTGRLEKSGFKFDTGPSWFFMPEAFEHYFSLLGERLEDYIKLERLTPAFKVFYDYRDPVTIWGNQTQDSKTLEELEPGAAKQLQSYLKHAESTYNYSHKHFLYDPTLSSNFMKRAGWALKLSRTSRLLGTPLHNHVSKSFHTLPVQQLFEYPSIFLGSSPSNTPALYQSMNHIDFTQGAYHPVGGMYAVVKALQKIGKKAGVRYHFNAPVDKIHINNGRATGVQVNGQRILGDLVISSADLHHTETKLLPHGARSYPQSYWRNRTAGPSAMTMYLGVQGKIPELKHHNLLLVKEWAHNFDDIFRGRSWPRTASMYAYKPTTTDPSLAPEGHENLVVTIPLPAGRMASDQETEVAADDYLAQLESIAKIKDLRERLVVAKLHRPDEFGSQLNAWQNTATGIAHTPDQSVFGRPSGRSPKVSNLLYAGSDVQPGIGVPMCLISAELAFKHLTGNRSSGPLTELEPPSEGWYL